MSCDLISGYKFSLQLNTHLKKVIIIIFLNKYHELLFNKYQKLAELGTQS